MSSDEMSGASDGDDLSASQSSQQSLAQSNQNWGGDDDEMLFGDAAEEKPLNDYEIVKATEVMHKPLEMMREVNELLEVHPTVARQLLQHCGWNQEKLVTRYFAGEKKKLFAEAKIPPELGEYKKPSGTTTCPVCFDDFKPADMFGLPCNHFLCRECYSDYLVSKVNLEGQAANIACPTRDCFLMVDELTATELLPAGPTKDRYLNLVAKSFVRDNKYYKGCPAPGCGNFARMALLARPTVVHCTCGQDFCSGCSLETHRPCDCSMMEQWLAKIQSDSESENWLKLYTRPCVKCKAIISKDGGCQYVRCRTCNTTFCWLCMGVFDHKNHDCNKLELAADATDAAKSLAKWNHFSKRYGAHAQAISLQSKLTQTASQMKDKLEKEFGMTWIETTFMSDAVATVIAARRVLRDTYIYGFFLPEYVNRELFEFLQGQLESKVEELSQLVETKDPATVKASRLKIIDIEKVLKQNLGNVLAGLEKGDVKGGNAETNKKETWEALKVEYDGWVYNAGH